MSEDNTTEDVTSEETITDEAAETQDGADETKLGDAGKQALDRMKAERNAAKAEAKAHKAELEQLRSAAALKDKPADEQAIETARSEARAEATKAANTRIVKSELRLAAKGVLADPADALAFINLDDFDVNDDGDVDADALNEAIADLLTRKPHLAAAAPRKFEGTGDQGAQRKAAAASQLTDADLENMTPAEINEARRQGRFTKLLGAN